MDDMIDFAQYVYTPKIWIYSNDKLIKSLPVLCFDEYSIPNVSDSPPSTALSSILSKEKMFS